VTGTSGCQAGRRPERTGGDRTSFGGDSQRRRGAEVADLKTSGAEERGSGRPDRKIEGVRWLRKAAESRFPP
jgi:hypothetical protein